MLTPREAAWFARHANVDGDAAGDAALALLRALLQPRPEQRPRHALEISRLITRARASIVAGAGAAPLRSAA
jgi:serine/threonine-protein kinase